SGDHRGCYRVSSTDQDGHQRTRWHGVRARRVEPYAAAWRRGDGRQKSPGRIHRRGPDRAGRCGASGRGGEKHSCFEHASPRARAPKPPAPGLARGERSGLYAQGLSAGRDIVITQTQGISAEQLQRLAEELGVTKAALTSFFKILEQQNVPLEDLDAKLRE